MADLAIIDAIFKLADDWLDFLFLWGGLLFILNYPVYFFVKTAIKNNKDKRKNPQENKTFDLLSQTLILFIVVAIAGILWAFPELIVFGGSIPWPSFIPPTWVRWMWLSLLFLFFAHHFGHEYGEDRWLPASLSHVAAILLGYLIDRWTGIFFISVPVLFVYYVIIYHMAMILVPASKPEDGAERGKRFHVLMSYMWGIQSPLVVVDGHAWKTPDTRIPGDFTWDFSDFPLPIIEKLDWRPGLIWTKPHHVLAITNGTNFRRIDGPGVVFTGTLERAFQVFDLRLQLRTNEIDVVSKDGVSFKARVFTAFRLDPDTWDEEAYEQLRRSNPILRGAAKPNYILGSFPFSHSRVQATLAMTSSKVGGDKLIYWDQWVLSVIENTARKVLSQKNLDELWRPAEDKKFANALDGIATEIKTAAAQIIRNAGILLVVGRVANFSFPGEPDQLDDISKQQIATWGSEWERKSSRILAEAQAESEQVQQEARAYAESLMLNAIADGLQKTQEIDLGLPRYVISMRFLSALQDFIHKQPSEKTLEEIKNQIMELSEQHYRSQGRERKL